MRANKLKKVKVYRLVIISTIVDFAGLGKCGKMKNGNTYSFIVSIVALVLSVVTLFRSKPIEADWATLLVGVLSLLVVALTFWNVYNVVYMNRIAKKQAKKVFDKTNKLISAGALESFAFPVRVNFSGLRDFDVRKMMGNLFTAADTYLSMKSVCDSSIVDAASNISNALDMLTPHSKKFDASKAEFDEFKRIANKLAAYKPKNKADRVEYYEHTENIQQTMSSVILIKPNTESE